MRERERDTQTVKRTAMNFTAAADVAADAFDGKNTSIKHGSESRLNDTIMEYPAVSTVCRWLLRRVLLLCSRRSTNRMES